MARGARSREPPIVILPPVPSHKSPATLIFLHGYNDASSSFNPTPPNHLSVAHHIHKAPSLQHIKVIIPNGLPCIHPSVKKNVWYNIGVPFPMPIDPRRAQEDIEVGPLIRNEDDMAVSMDYLESLVSEEISTGTPAKRVVIMGYSQGAAIATLFLLTRKLASDLGAMISCAGFAPTPMESIFRMQRENQLKNRWSKETKLFLLHGGSDIFLPLEVFRAWFSRLQGLKDCGQGIAHIEGNLIDGMGHRLIEQLWPATRNILEGVVPASEQKNSFKL